MIATAASPAADSEVAELLAAEERRQLETLCLIPSENHVSPGVLAASGSVFTNKYSEGYPRRRYYEGNAVVDSIEILARRARRGAVRRRPRERAAATPGARRTSPSTRRSSSRATRCWGWPRAGGHLTHGLGRVGDRQVVPRRSLRRAARHGRVDIDEVREIALRERPKLIWCGGTAIPRTIDFAGFAAVASEVGAVLAADVAHIAGLIAGGAHPSPAAHADVISTTTHKTLRGPRGAMLHVRGRARAALDRAVFPGLQGGPHDHTTAAIAVALHEAAQPAFAAYAHAIVANAKALGDALSSAASTSSRAGPTTTCCSST